MYSFTDGFSGYHQIRISKEDRHKTTFVTEWGYFQYTVMPFGLKYAPAVFSRDVVATFKDFIQKFLQVYMDDWTVYGLIKDHLANLRLMPKRCWQHQITLNSKKCIFCAPFGILLGHIVCKKGLLVDPMNIALILNFPLPMNVKMLRATLGHTRYYCKFIQGYVAITPPMENYRKRTLYFYVFKSVKIVLICWKTRWPLHQY